MYHSNDPCTDKIITGYPMILQYRCSCYVNDKPKYVTLTGIKLWMYICRWSNVAARNNVCSWVIADHEVTLYMLETILCHECQNAQHPKIQMWLCMSLYICMCQLVPKMIYMYVLLSAILSLHHYCNLKDLCHTSHSIWPQLQIVILVKISHS